MARKRLFCHSTAVLNDKGVSLVSLGKNNEAITYFDKALAVKPDHVPSLNGKGAALANLGSYYEGIQYLDKALAINPNYAVALDNKNKILELLKSEQ
jgi:tetratricopeptide (TPR) repeat protein